MYSQSSNQMLYIMYRVGRGPRVTVEHNGSWYPGQLQSWTLHRDGRETGHVCWTPDVLDGPARLDHVPAERIGPHDPAPTVRASTPWTSTRASAW